jgi:PAS domain S-box-containing protein
MPKHTILAVDDEVEILELYRKVFNASPASDFDLFADSSAEELSTVLECRTYSDPEKLLEEYRREVAQGIHHPLCIVDMKMPLHAEGLETAGKLREIDPDIHIVFCTANSKIVPEEIHARLRERVFFVLKPPNIEEFTVMVRSLVDYWQSRQDLRRETAFLERLLESVPDLIFMKDSKGIYMTCNKTFARFAKRAPEEIIGGSDCDFLPPELCRTFLEQDIQVMESGRPLTYEQSVEHPDGGWCVLETVKSPVFAKNGECIGLIGIARDITNRSQKE